MEMRLNKTIFFIFSLILLSCKGDAQHAKIDEKQQIKVNNEIDFFDKKLDKSFYSLIIDESNISDHPIKSYVDCKKEGYFTVHFIPKTENLRHFWKVEFLKNYNFDNMDSETDSKKIYDIIKNKFTDYNIFAYQIKREFLYSNGDCTEESAFANKNSIANIYYFNPTNKKWEFLKYQKSEILPPYFNSDYFLINFSQYFATSTKNKINNTPSTTSISSASQSKKWNGIYDLNIDYGKLDDNAEMSINYNLEIKNGMCTFSGMGYKTYFTDICEIKEENNKLILKYLKSTDGDGFSDHSNLKILGVITQKNNEIYLNSPIVADSKWNYNTDIKLRKVK